MNTSRQWLYCVSALAIIALIYLLAPILTPFILGLLIAYMGSPLVRALHRYKIPRTLGVLVVFVLCAILLALLFFLIVPLIERQLVVFFNKVPEIITWLQSTVFPWVVAHFSLPDDAGGSILQNILPADLSKFGKVAQIIVHTITQSGAAIALFITNLVLVPVVAFYFMRDWDKVCRRVLGLVPDFLEEPLIVIARECDEVIGAFFRGQLMVMLMLALIYSMGLSILGLQMALIIGLLSGLLAIVPYLGFIVGVLAASLAALLQFHDVEHLLFVLIVYIVGQCLESMVLTPCFVGHRLGLHPVAVIFAILAGGALFGFLGVLLALPVAAIMLVFAKHAQGLYE
jgi:predicted PurR-regulated permease PerM